MSRFRKQRKNEIPVISTASLPDIIFMLLFFFMVTTQLRKVEVRVETKLPAVWEVKKLEKKTLISYIYVGKPVKSLREKLGDSVRIQLNDAFSDVSDIPRFIAAERATKNSAEIPQMTVSLKIDEKAPMGIVTDIKQELRKCNALKINYSTRKPTDK